MIWRSPLWMPLAWEVVAVQFGYIGLRLWERFGKLGLLMFALLVRTLRRGSARTAIFARVGAGIAIFTCYAVAFFITDRLIP
jgi:hypothetical protein